MDLDIDACYRAFRTRDPRFDGRLFSGVRTTGIYCRPICPARTPKRENMLFFPTAAAAQDAGFRPCLRCRPETAPDLAAWRGTSNTVSRALGLIEAGALDERGVGCLADRLGVGERQLRRLFQKHLGASPVAVAQTRRVLLALQLVHETHLPMTDVALAAGFTSIRRFNEVFQRLFRRPPGALRRVGKTVPEVLPTGEVIVLLRYRLPYDWHGMLAFLHARAIAGVEAVSGHRYARTIEIDGRHGLVVVESAAGQALKATIRFPRLAELPRIIARLRRVFDLAADPQAIGAQLAEDALLAPLVAIRPGLRVPGAWDGFELAVRALLGQHITVKAAVRLATTLVEEYGEPLSVPNPAIAGLTHVFPCAERLASADLTRLEMPVKRIQALKTLAAAVTSDPQLFGPGAEPMACTKRLRAMAGIGEWTAQYIAMRELREPDAFPADDIALKRALAEREGRWLTSREVIARAERWRPWRAYAAQHLWAAMTDPRPQHR
ncbi:MAG TPA: AlkA N-terminal domain-containing protein [Vicinamibacterales bacterium]|nr:AlkA N-terminal domain-containing protein [Vicinamibacterales bacterium]